LLLSIRQVKSWSRLLMHGLKGLVRQLSKGKAI
jgi:hypothetical protein